MSRVEQVPFILGKSYLPNHDENRMGGEGDVIYARENFLRDRFPNLDYLLQSRYCWMNEYINVDDVILEIGCGAGFSSLYLKKKPILTDAVKNKWVEKCIDATSMDIENESIDILIVQNAIHHCYSPFRFFMEALRVLKPGGRIMIQEVNNSLLMRIILRLMRQEGWSYDIDIFNENEMVTDKYDLWSGNNAIPQLLFSDEKKFNTAFHCKKYRLVIEFNQLCECFIFPLSGGVTSKINIPQLPLEFMKFANFIDKIITKIWPSIFAMARRVVIQKKTL